MTETVKHMAGGREYEIRITRAGYGIDIETYRDDGKAVGVIYRASYNDMANFDATGFHLTGSPAFETLVKLAKDDLDLGIVK